VKWTCRSCGSHCFCEHGRQRYKCKDCNAARRAAAGSGQPGWKSQLAPARRLPHPSTYRPPPAPPPPPPASQLPAPPPEKSSNLPAAVCPAVHVSPSGPGVCTTATLGRFSVPVLQQPPHPPHLPHLPTPPLLRLPTSPTTPETPRLLRLLPPLLPCLPSLQTAARACSLPRYARPIAVHPSRIAPEPAAEQPLRLSGSAFSTWSGHRKRARTSAAAAPLAGGWSEQAVADAAAAGAARCEGAAAMVMGGWPPPLLPDIRVGAGIDRMEQREFRLVRV
jgi:hypothetical protein